MKAKWLPISAAVALALGSVSASAVDFHGYMRAGMSYAAQGGSAYCIGHGGAGHIVGRLGDECDTYAEIGLSQEVFNKADNKFTVNTLMVWGTKEGNWDTQYNPWQGVSAPEVNRTGQDIGQRASLREAYAEYTMPNGASIWAGKRYNQRKDVHIMDYYYLNNSGYGLGIHNIAAGNLGSLNFDIIKSNPGAFGEEAPEQDVTINSYKLQAGWRGIPMWTDASLDIDLIYAWENLDKWQKSKEGGNQHGNNGFMALVEYTQGNFFGGFNKLSFTYGSDALDGVGVATWNHEAQWVIPYKQRGNGYRFLDWGVIEQPSWNLGYAVILTHNDVKNMNDNKDGGSSWTPATGNDYVFVIRPSYKWSDFTSTVLEYGYANLNSAPSDTWNRFDASKADRNHRTSLSKLTIAQQWTPGSHFWARPSIRVFATWMSGKGMDNRNTHLEDNHQIVLGGQVEAWW